VEHYAGLDVSLELTSVCIVDAQGGIVCETKVPSEPEAPIRFLRAQELQIGRVGPITEAVGVDGSQPLTQLVAGLAAPQRRW
jgi:hypothetical protein